MSPYGWGHSHLLGRAKYHLEWLMSDLKVTQNHELVHYLAAHEVFPEVFRFGHNEALTQKLRLAKLDAYQIASAMIFMPFALACCRSRRVTTPMITAWRLENVFAIDYYRSSFTAVQLNAHEEIWRVLKKQVHDVYVAHRAERALQTKVKFHDPEHDREIILAYGSFRIVNELPKEAEHQTPKHVAHNNRTVELQMLKKANYLSYVCDGVCTATIINFLQAVMFEQAPEKQEEMLKYLHPRAGTYRKEGMKGKAIAVLFIKPGERVCTLNIK